MPNEISAFLRDKYGTLALTAEQAADVLDIGVEDVEMMLRSGELQGKTLGTKTRISVYAFEKILSGNTEKHLDTAITTALPSHPLNFEECNVSEEEFQMNQALGGSVFQNATRGTWHFAYYFDDGGIKKRKVETCRNEGEARERQQLFKAGREQSKVMTYPRVQQAKPVTLVKDFLPMIMKTEITEGKPLSTAQSYEYDAKYIYRELGDRAIDSITRSEVKDFLNNLKTKRGLDAARPTKERVRFLLGAMFRFALEADVIHKNPMAIGVKILGDTESEDPRDLCLDIDVLKRVMVAVRGDQIYEPIVKTLLYTGVRIGELIALSWDRVDLENGFITINQALKRFKVIKDENGKESEFELNNDEKDNSREINRTAENWSRVGKTKNKETRRIPIGGSLLELLKELNASRKPSVPWVFPNQDGELRSYDGLRAQMDKFWAKKNLAGEQIRFHRFRHSFSSYLISAKVEKDTRRVLMGHQGENITQVVYEKTMDDILTEAMTAYYQYMGDQLGTGECFHR